MNKKEKEWIRENLRKIFITDIEENNDSQIEDTMNFLPDLALKVDFDICTK